MKILLKAVAIIISILISVFIVFYCYVFFINPNILDFSTDDLKAVRNACNQVKIGSEVKSLIDITNENGVSLSSTPDFIEVSKGVCFCRLKNKNNKITKKYAAGCKAKQ